ncbi:MAG TPA: RHS repeat-associated core domain-containing protein, partial [Blastocatellia bacterium]|nr:RHS repeat-associated core domain-containing protein [Blastocatellia bacterium]
TDALGGVTRYGYDAQGHVLRETDALGHVTTFTYDANGNLLSQTTTRTLSSGSTETLSTTFDHDKLNRLTKTTYADGSTTQVIYNSIGQQSIVIDQLGRQTSVQYDDMGRVVSTSYPDGTSAGSTYDAEGRRLTSTDQAGRITTFEYDELGRLKKTIYADGFFGGTTTYDEIGRAKTLTDPRGNTTRYEYDSANRCTKVIDALNHETTFSYDANGNQASMTDARNNSMSYEYDSLNRQTKMVYADSTFSSTTYDALGRATAKTDQAGKTIQFEVDKLGRLVKVTDALSQQTRYSYDEAGNQRTQTDANNHTTLFEYDKLGRRVKRTLPLGMFETYSYNAAGNLVGRTDFRGKTTTYSYDLMNRLTRKTPDASLAEPLVSFTYTVTGRRASMADASGTTSYSYDLRDRLTSKATPQGTLSYSYDVSSNLITLRSSNTNGASVNYSYDDLNRLSTVTDNPANTRPGTGSTSYSYDAVGNLDSFVYPNGVKHTYTYSTLNRLTNIAITTGPPTTLASFTYTLGAAGNRTGVSELSGRHVTYSYDDLYRLTAETINTDPTVANNGSIKYVYDPVGNRESRTSSIAAVPTTASAYDANDRLTVDSYDANGSTTASGSNTYRYDFENRIVALNAGTLNPVTFVYDGDGNRVAKTVGGVTTKFLVDTNNPTCYAQVVEEIVGGATQRAYVHGHSLISQTQLISGNWVTSFYGYDGHGSVRLLLDTTAAATDTYIFDAFGNLITSTGTTPNIYLYTGEQFDPQLGLYYLRARYVNAATGRFWTMDEFGGSSSDPVSLHKYLYANADPANGTDPSGQFTIAEFAVATAVRATIGALAGILVNGINNYALGKRFFDGAAGAAAFGAAALPLSIAFPILGVVLASLGVVGSGVSAWQVFSNPNTSAGQRGAAAFLVALSVVGVYGAAKGIQQNGLWVNARYLERGGVAGSGRTGAMASMLNEILGRVAEFKDVLDTLPRQQKNGITMGVGIAEDAGGVRQTLIATSEPRGYIRGPMRGLIRATDIVVKGAGDAEADIVAYANAQGWTLIAVGATRPICPACAAAIAAAGATAVTPLK